MADDAAYLALVERFRAVLGGPDLQGHMQIDAEEAAVAESVGEKRNRHRADPEDKPKPSKKGRGLSEWFLVYSLFAHKPKKQRYLHHVADDRVKEHIRKGFLDGLYISCVSSSLNLWALMLDAGTGYTAQVYNITPVFLDKDWIVEWWSKKYFITAVAGANNGTAMIVMSQGPEYVQQSYKISKKIPLSWIKKKWRQGFFVTSIGTCAKRWAVVMSVTSEFKDQVLEVDCSYPIERLHRLRSRGLQITAVGNTHEQAAVVLSIPSERAPALQEVMSSASFPSTYLKEHWSRHMYVSSLSYGRTNHFEGKAAKFAISR